MRWYSQDTKNAGQRILQRKKRRQPVLHDDSGDGHETQDAEHDRYSLTWAKRIRQLAEILLPPHSRRSTRPDAFLERNGRRSIFWQTTALSSTILSSKKKKTRACPPTALCLCHPFRPSPVQNPISLDSDPPKSCHRLDTVLCLPHLLLRLPPSSLLCLRLPSFALLCFGSFNRHVESRRDVRGPSRRLHTIHTYIPSLPPSLPLSLSPSPSPIPSLCHLLISPLTSLNLERMTLKCSSHTSSFIASFTPSSMLFRP